MRKSLVSNEAALEAIVQMSTALAEDTSLGLLLERAVRLVQILTKADAVAIFLLDHDNSELRLSAQHGFPTRFVHDMALLKMDSTDLITHAIATGQLQLARTINDLPQAFAANKEWSQRYGWYSLAAVPLQAKGETLGTTVLAWRQPQHFPSSQVLMIESTARVTAAGTVTTTRLAKERHMRVVLEAVNSATLAISAEVYPRQVLQTIVDCSRRVADARYAALGIGTNPENPFNPWVFSVADNADIRDLRQVPRPVGLLGAAVREGSTIRVRDLTKDPRFRDFASHHPFITSFLKVPIRYRGKIIGDLFLANKSGAVEFSKEDEETIEMLAAHAAIAYEHAQLYEQVQIAHSRLQTVFENSPAGIIFVDGRTDYVYENKAAQDFLGRPLQPKAGRQQYIGQFCRPDGTPMSLEELPTTRALCGEAVIGAELIIHSADGHHVPALANAAPVSDAEGTIAGAVLILQDITPVKLERLREEFISAVAHDLRTPISVIIGFGELLSKVDQGRRASQTEGRELEAIVTAAKRLNRMVEDLLDISRIEARRLTLEKRSVDIVALVEGVINRLKNVLAPHPVSLIKGKVPRIETDPGRIEQVMINLITNAGKYSPPESEIILNVASGKHEVVFSVTDHGQGIPEADIPNLFTRFYRTMGARNAGVEGLGLGLYISRELVEALGGRIWVESELGKGSTFFFSLPTHGGETTATDSLYSSSEGAWRP